MARETWKELLEEAMAGKGECLADLVFTTLSDKEMEKKFDSGYGGSEGAPFTAWTATRVYFPAVYDGAEWVESVPRNPCNEATTHVGGE